MEVHSNIKVYIDQRLWNTRFSTQVTSKQIFNFYRDLKKPIIPRYNDKFRDKNANELRHIFNDRQVNLNDIIWETNLREYKNKNIPIKNRKYQNN